MGVQVLNSGSMFQIYFNVGKIRSSRDTGGIRSQAETDFYLHHFRQWSVDFLDTAFLYLSCPYNRAD